MALKYFKINSGNMIISDPSYSRDDMMISNLLKNVATGVWTAEVTNNKMGRIASLTVYNNLAQILDPSITTKIDKAPEVPFLVGVDSGTAGFFDANYYQIDDSVKDCPIADYLTLTKPGDIFYAACAYQKLDSGIFWGTIPFGAIAQSGWGDGAYKILGLKDNLGDYVALKLIFLDTIEDYSDINDPDDEESDDDI